MSFREKMDVIDFIIITLTKHEKKLDDLIYWLEMAFDELIYRLEITIERIEMK